ncbi:SGNH/GDSL hydrolase family protein [Massilia sp. IC2-477]|uniref:SGNH/GDSL hydrolase family protein n=1 Tax=Massilia sp. IC2-477 TaxID=2887198 RepID=UPI001D0FBD32|nr:SGNH/GDSL hydrolase family protein [Massilia sp. IC2-477]MCC2955403.1 SGNH/GDSL hydrolase family protein [Massilia sp. IC2-477]
MPIPAFRASFPSLSNSHTIPYRAASTDRGRRRFLLGVPALAGALGLAPRSAFAQSWRGEGWSATWGCAPAGPPPAASTTSFSGQTVRMIVRASIGGNRIRVRLTNEMGNAPLTIGAAQVGLRASAQAVVAGSNHPLTFGGRTSVTIQPGSPLLSDPVYFQVAPFADLAISLYFPGTALGTTIHRDAWQTNYVSTSGNFAASSTFTISRSFASWPFLSEVDVDGGAPCVVAIGDSITDGQGSTANQNRRWPDYLARRLQSELGTAGRIGVVNRGIAGNRLLLDDPNALLAGRDVLERFDRDVLATPGIRAVIVAIGINDIVYASGTALGEMRDDLVAGYRQLIARAHARGIAILGATLPPMAGFVYYTAAREAVRQQVNSWLRSANEFDALIDWDGVLRDPSSPARIRPDYNSRDWLHPNDAGYGALANAVPLGELTSMVA